ncbi:MAG: TIGR01212 family radical SAM protein, partial [Firmicutes bacterium]|nr:TIGR01212 family radical SAM protein [Bacillota bacterium]
MSKNLPPELRGKRFNSISDYLKEEFGKKTIKLAIDGGFTCPNRDGSKGSGGCTFCSDTGSGEFSSDIDDQIRLLSDKWPDAAYLAYFQNHTNTYAPVEELREKYYSILKDPRIKGLVIGTRPDCLGDDVLDLLSEINSTHFMWVELGLQTIHEKTAERINRCYGLDEFDEAMNKLRSRGIRAVVHLILGLPGESREMMLESVKYVASKPGLFGMKVAKPENTCVTVVGDFGLTFMGEEIAVASVFHKPIIVVVLNNAYLGLIRQNQVGLGFEYAVEMPYNQDGTIDYVKLGEAYGCKAERVFTPAELADALQRAKAESEANGNCYVIDAISAPKQLC